MAASSISAVIAVALSATVRRAAYGTVPTPSLSGALAPGALAWPLAVDVPGQRAPAVPFAVPLRGNRS